MVKNIIGSIFITVIIAVTIFLIIMNIPQENQNQIIGEMNYKEIQENFFSKEFKASSKSLYFSSGEFGWSDITIAGLALFLKTFLIAWNHRKYKALKRIFKKIPN